MTQLEEGTFEKNLKIIDISTAEVDTKNPNIYHKQFGFQINNRERQTIQIDLNKDTLDLILNLLDEYECYFGIVPDERGNDPILRIYLYDDNGNKLCNRDLRLEVLSLLAYYKNNHNLNLLSNKCILDIIEDLDRDIISTPTSAFNKFDYIHFKGQYNFLPENLDIRPTNNAFRLDKICEFLYCMFKDKDRFRRIHKDRFEDYCNNDFAKILNKTYNREDVWVVTQCQNTIRKSSKFYARIELSNGHNELISLKIPNLSMKLRNILNSKYKNQNFDYLEEVKKLINNLCNRHNIKILDYWARLDSSSNDKYVYYNQLNSDDFTKINGSQICLPYTSKMISIDIYDEVLKGD